MENKILNFHMELFYWRFHLIANILARTANIFALAFQCLFNVIKVGFRHVSARLELIDFRSNIHYILEMFDLIRSHVNSRHVIALTLSDFHHGLLPFLYRTLCNRILNVAPTLSDDYSAFYLFCTEHTL